MSNPSRVKMLPVLTSQGVAGQLHRESQYVFNYRTADPACEISLTMPLRAQSYVGSILPGVLRQNLPEGYLLDWIRERFAKVAKMDDMTVMAISGRKSIGRVHCVETTVKQPPSESLKSILTWKGTESLFEHLAEQFAAMSGISGVQPKVLVTTKSEDVIEKASIKEQRLIVKSSGDDYPGLAENEYACMSIAKAAGLSVPPFWLSDDKKLFVIERFDVVGEQYLGFEDMTALMNRQNHEKYNGSYEQIAIAIRAFGSPMLKDKSLADLFSIVALSVLVRNGDAHLKNFGLLYTTPQTNDIRLAPAYDIVNTTAYIPKDTLALNLNKTKSWPLKRDLVEFGKKHCGIDRPEEVLERIATAAMEYRPPEDSGIYKTMQPIINDACFEFCDRRAIGKGWEPEVGQRRKKTPSPSPGL